MKTPFSSCPTKARTISLCALSLLAATAPVAFAQPSVEPLVRVGQATTAPEIDGALNDDAWKQSVEVGDFSVVGSNAPVAEPTRVRLVYDAHNLYISWRVEESLLVVAQQRMHEVKADAKTRDADVFADDNVLLFLQPKADGEVFEFNLNSAGALFDAKSRADKLWEARDASWNSDAKIASAREDGFWTAELAIPWRSFGLTAPPAKGTVWPINLLRRAIGRKENSAWAQSGEVAIHLFSNWGQLVFDAVVPGLSIPALPKFEAGKSSFAAQLVQAGSTPGAGNVTVEIAENGVTKKFSNAFDKAIRAVVPLTASGEKPIFRWSAQNASGEYLYRSPQLLIATQSSRAQLKISTTKDWTLFINGEKTAQGPSAKNQNIEFGLLEGANDIVLEAQSGQAELQLITPGIAPAEAIAWRTHAADEKARPGTDRRTWNIAPRQNNAVGTAGKPAFLQHTLLWKSTLHYPAAQPALYLAQGAAQQILFLVEGVPQIRFDKWELLLAVPSQFEVLGANGLYGNYIKGKPKFLFSKAGEKNINGQSMTLYRVAADAPIVHTEKANTMLVSLEVLVRLPKTARFSADDEWNFYYWTQGNGGAVSEASQTVALRALPPLSGKQPQKFVWELWTSGTHVYDDQELVKNVLDTARQAGFNRYAGASSKVFNELVGSYGMKQFNMIHFRDSRTMDLVTPYLAAHPDEKLLDKTGTRLDNFMCTTKLMGDNWPMFAKSITDITKSSGASYMEYDYEYPPFGPPHACFDEHCLTQFREFSKLGSDVQLTPVIVQKEYSPQWIDFMAYRTAVLLKKMQQAVHEGGAKFSSYSGYYNAEDDTTKTRYGIDWNLVGEMQAVDEAGMGYGRPEKSVADSRKALRGIPIKMGALLVPYDVRSRQPVTQVTPATLLRRALDATGGVLVYTRNSMDGRSWKAVADISRITADFESIFLRTDLQEIPGQDAAVVQLAKGDGQTLLCVMNPSSKARDFSIPVPAALGAGREYSGDQKIAAGQTLQLTLEPGETKVFAFEK